MLVAVRRPGHPLGWILLGAAILFSVDRGAVAYSILDYRLHRGALPLGRLALALQPAWAGGLVLIAGCLWLFPDGCLPSGHWRRTGGILFAAGLAYGALMFVPWTIAALGQPLKVCRRDAGRHRASQRLGPDLAARRERGLFRAVRQLGGVASGAGAEIPQLWR
ncbi:MAG: hypothetical protein M3Z75_32820 [Actinomycetota bacterium]|nr:hypothetical protein [Actinomycetota bacterium]